jgi:hypothetical protein
MDLLPPATAIAKQNIPFDYNPQREILFPVRLDGHPVTAALDTGAVQKGLNIWDIFQYRLSSMQIGVTHWDRPTLAIAGASAFESLEPGP